MNGMIHGNETPNIIKTEDSPERIEGQEAIATATRCRPALI
jgi:hypothetical protein